jgi:FMN-dependent NADH-azoreductase
MKLLHIVATPRALESNTLRTSTAFIESMHAKYADLDVDVINVFQSDLPAVAGDNIESKYTLMVGQPIDKRHKDSWVKIETLIEHFLSADVYLVSTPMWNFGIPYALKYYIDAIVQPGYLFKYNELGQAIGLVQGRKMVCITSRGGDYSALSPFHAFDFQEPYLRAIFGFVGITEMHFINAQPMDVTLDLRQAAIRDAVAEAQQLVSQSEWGPAKVAVPEEHPAALKPQVL